MMQKVAPGSLLMALQGVFTILAYLQKRADTSLFLLHVILTRFFLKVLRLLTFFREYLYLDIARKNSFVSLMATRVKDSFCLFCEYKKQFHQNEGY